MLCDLFHVALGEVTTGVVGRRSTTEVASYPGLLTPAFVPHISTASNNAEVRRPGYKATTEEQLLP